MMKRLCAVVLAGLLLAGLGCSKSDKGADAVISPKEIPPMPKDVKNFDGAGSKSVPLKLP